MPFLHYKDVQIHYQAETTGSENVLFLHGFLEDLTMWEAFAASFPAKYRKITIDLPGFGQSDCLGYVHSMEEMAEVAKAVLDHLKIKRITLIGHSMGGYVSLAFTELFPDAVKGVVLFYSTPFADSPEKQKDRDRAIQAVKHERTSFIKTAIPNLFAPDNRAKYEHEIQKLVNAASTFSGRGIVAALEGMKNRLDREVLLHFGPCDVQLVVGKQDPVLPIEKLEDLFKAPKVWNACVTPGGHMGHIEDVEMSRNAVLKFLRRG
jgi:pimeloyl-ACP methyl ester carboxylesterase